MQNKFNLVAVVILLAVLSSCAKISKKLGLKKPRQQQVSKLRLAWTKNLDPEYLSGNLPIGHGTPLIYKDQLLFSDQLGWFNVYDLNTGRKLWGVNEKKSLTGKLGVYNNRVYYTSYSGRVYCRNLLTKKLEYATDLKAPIEAEPLFYGGRVFYHLRNHQVMVLDASTGKILWSYKRAIPYSTTLQRVSTPVAYKDKIIVGFADGHVGAFNIDEGVLTWETKISTGTKFVDVDVDPVIFGDKVVISSAHGNLKFLSIETGEQVISVEVTPGHTPIKMNNRIVFGTLNGEVVIVDRFGKLGFRKKVSEYGISSMARYKKGFVASSYDGKIHYLGSQQFKQVETFNLGTDQSAVFGRIVHKNNMLAVYSSRNRLYVFQ